MSNTLFPLVRPIVDLWDYLTHDQTMRGLEKFKGGAGTWQAWNSKAARAEQEKVYNEIQGLRQRFTEEPKLEDVAWDNAARLTVFAGFERLFALRQALPNLKHRFFMADSSLGALGEIFGNGIFRGYFRGALLNAGQFLGVAYNNLLWASGKDLHQQILFSSLFEAFFYPLDTIKTLLYCDLAGTYKGGVDCLGKIVEQNGLGHLYRGLPLKITYNAFFLWHLKNFYEDSALQYLSLPAWIASYGFLAVKTRTQIADTALSFQSLKDANFMEASKYYYRGVIPFVALNLLVSYQFYGLYSKNAQNKKISELEEKFDEFKNPFGVLKLERVSRY